MLRSEDVSKEYLEKSKMFHFSEAMLRKSQTRKTVFKIIQVAKEKRVSISYDPNVREALWNNMEEFHKTQNMVLNVTSIFLATSKEAALIAGGSAIEETLGNILSLGPSIVVLRERHQYEVAALGKRYTIPIFEVKAVDTSGAGDVFIAGFLTGLAKKLAVDRAVMFGSAAAAIKVMTAGTRGGLPEIKDVVRFIKERTSMEFSF